MDTLTVRTGSRRGLIDITAPVADAVKDHGDGVWVVFVPHTTAGITINEGADPDVARDVLMAWERLAPEDLPYRHVEGNSPAHVLACIAGSSVLVAVEGGALRLGSWQAIFLCEFDGPRSRNVWLKRL